MSPYEPCKLPIGDLDFRRLLPLVGKANRELARYDGLLQGLVNPDIMLSPLTMEEATFSSRLEGTQATVDDVYEHEAGIEKSPEKTNDVHEIVNYRSALRLGQRQLSAYPITLPFIRELHKTLLNSVRGKDKSPGEFRIEQNWIGPYDSTLETATFVPVAPANLPQHLQDWQTYLSGDDIDVLVQTAVMHAQFELLHPFKDGNGRIGRLLIPLFLYQKKTLSLPMFYLSSYLEANREGYYASLDAISKESNWNGWIAFFLNAIAEQAVRNSAKVCNIKSLYDDMKDKIQQYTHSQYTVQVLDQIFKRPMFKTTEFVKETGIPKNSALTILRTLRENDVLKEFVPSSGRRPSIICFPSLLNTAEGKEIF